MRDRFDFVLAMCPTLESSTLLKQHIPESCVFDRYMQTKVDALVKLASEVAAAGKERNFLLILDDVMYDKAICRTQSFRYLFYNGRHCRISVVLLQQYLVDMPPDMRSQVDYVFTMKENTIANRIKLWRFFFGVFATFEDFCAVLERCTQNYETLMLDNTAQTNGPADCVFWYKAALECGPFQLGSKAVFTLEERYRRSVPLPSCMESNDEAAKAGQKGKAKLTVSKEETEPSGDDGVDIR